jgi:hypothetical protein
VGCRLLVTILDGFGWPLTIPETLPDCGGHVNGVLQVVMFRRTQNAHIPKPNPVPKLCFGFGDTESSSGAAEPVPEHSILVPNDDFLS